MKEILSLQIGSLSNFTGTHFWNNSEDLFNSENSKVLYRNGIQSYAPRLVSIDLKGSLNLVAPADDLKVQWTGKVQTVEKEKPSNSFLSNLDSNEPDLKSFAEDLETKVLYATDFSKLYYHQKSMVPIQQYSSGFSSFSQGVEIWENEEWRNSLLEEHIRFFMEECDNPQGFQVLTDVDDGFGGLASELLQKLYDEYPKKSILTISVGMDSDNDKVKLYNRSRGLHHLSQVSSLYVPLTIPAVETMKDAVWCKYLHKKRSMYHWSGYLSSVIQTMLYPTHFAISGGYMSQMEMACMFKKNNDAPLAALNVMLPFPIQNVDSGNVQNTLRVLKPGEFQSESINLTTMRPFDRASESIGQMAVLRGATNLIRSVELDGKTMHRYSSGPEIQNMMDNYLESFTCPFSKSVVIDDPFVCDQSFPDLCSSLSKYGIVSSNDVKAEQATQFAIMTRLHNSSDLHDFVMYHSQVLKARISSKSFDNILEAEELRDWTEDLIDLAQQYI